MFLSTPLGGRSRCPLGRGGALDRLLDCAGSEMGPHPADVHNLAPGKSTV